MTPRVSTQEPVQEFYSIGEVCELTDLKPHVLRYWESQFKFLNPGPPQAVGTLLCLCLHEVDIASKLPVQVRSTM